MVTLSVLIGVGEGVPICGGFDKKKCRSWLVALLAAPMAALGTRQQRALKVNVPFAAGHYRMGQQQQREQRFSNSMLIGLNSQALKMRQVNGQ